MGQEIFKDYEPGDECIQCFGESNVPIFGAGNLITPKYVQANAYGIIACPGNWEDANHSWLLTQWAPCTWRFIDDAWSVGYNAWISDMGLEYASFWIASKIDGHTYFESNTDICASVFANDYNIGDCGGLVGGHSGSVVVTWGPGIGP